MQRRAGRPKGEAATVVNVRIPLSLVERLDHYLDKVETATGLTTNRGAILRQALKVFLESKQMGCRPIRAVASWQMSPSCPTKIFSVVNCKLSPLRRRRVRYALPPFLENN